MSLSTIVVTGGAGFIGSHTVDRLLETDHRVVVLDNFSTGKRENLPNHPQLDVVTCDVRRGIADALAGKGPIAGIIHLAAQVSVVKSIHDPVEDMQINYGGTLHVLEYARVHGVRKVVLASSAAVYGDVAEQPIAETAPCVPVSPYGIHKLSSEHAMDYYALVHGVHSASLRFFNVYGPRQDPSSPYSGVISIFTARARAGEPLTIYGDGKQTRDFVFVADVVRAVIAALQSDHARLVANVGTGITASVSDLARTVVELCGNRSAILHAPARSGEIVESRAQVKRLREALGVVAETRLADGLRATVA